MKSRRFTLDDQLAFADLSGDWNPMHVDPVAARRLLYGAPVVHGVHILLWAMESCLDTTTHPIRLRRLRCAFLKPLRIGDEASLTLQQDSQGVRAEVHSDQTIVAKIEWEWENGKPPTVALNVRGWSKAEPLSPEEIESRFGQVDLKLDSRFAGRMFPSVLRSLGETQTTILLATTRLVGMECPGLRSIFSELTLTAADAGGNEPALRYRVTKLDRRFGLVLMNLAAPGITGTIKAFIRPTPQKQADYQTLKTLVNDGEFVGQRALIVGGSRGLGEVTAKLLAAGGADVRITYRQGKGEADRIVKGIVAGGGSAASMELDVLAPATRSLAQWKPTHLYYFATPAIFVGSRGTFSHALYEKFCDYYLRGFLNVMDALKSCEIRRVFHPSSVAIEEAPPDMTEYVAAKKEAELLCERLERETEGLVILRPRLPRVGTDQTVSMLPVENADPAPIMLGYLRALRDS